MDFIGEPGRATYRAGHVIDLTVSNIPFAKTTVRDDMHCGSDHYVQITTIPSTEKLSLDQFRYRVPESKLPQFASLVELGMSRVPGSRLARTPADIEQCVTNLTQVLDDAIRKTGKPD